MPRLGWRGRLWGRRVGLGGRGGYVSGRVGRLHETPGGGSERPRRLRLGVGRRRGAQDMRRRREWSRRLHGLSMWNGYRYSGGVLRFGRRRLRGSARDFLHCKSGNGRLGVRSRAVARTGLGHWVNLDRALSRKLLCLDRPG